MTGPFYCPAQTFAGRYHIDPEPPEYCGAEVPEPDYCPQHEEQDDDFWGAEE